MGKDIDWDYIFETYPNIDFGPKGVEEMTAGLRRLMAYNPNKPPVAQPDSAQDSES